jgi:hypothetical protein
MLKGVRLILLLLPMLAVHAADVEFLHVWPNWRNADSFDRIREYFGGQENTARNVVLRTQPEPRAGYYFLVRVKTASALSGAKFDVHVIRPDAPVPKVFSFPVAIPANETVYQLGLTGIDWPGGEKANPVAWKLVLVGADGRVLAEHKSFLWEKPPK